MDHCRHARIQKVLSEGVQDYFVDDGEGGSKCEHKLAIIGPPAKRRRADNGPTWNSGFIAL